MLLLFFWGQRGFYLIFWHCCCRTTFPPFEIDSFVSISTYQPSTASPSFVCSVGFLVPPCLLILQDLKGLLHSYHFPWPGSSFIFSFIQRCFVSPPLPWRTSGHVSTLKVSFTFKFEKGCLLIYCLSPWISQQIQTQRLSNHSLNPDHN